MREREVRLDDDVGRLITAAGPRPAVPAADLAAIKSGFRQAWSSETVADKAATRPTRARRWRAPLALAASLLVAVGGVWWWLGGPPWGAEHGVVANIARIDGSASLAVSTDARDLALSATDAPLDIVAGSELATAAGGESAGRVALRLAGGTSLRLDSGSRVRLLSAGSLELTAGAVYVDTSTAEVAHGIEIRTSIGIARDIGTQFEVRLVEESGAMRVTVRDGAVRVEHGATSARVERAQVLTLSADGAMVRGVIPTHGAPWDWTLRVAPRFDAQAATVSAYLDWLAGETGWRVVFEDPSLEATARAVRIHGGIAHLDPDQTPDAVVPSLGFSYRLEDGVLTILGPSGAR